MIKIDVPNIDEIADAYCERLMESVKKNNLKEKPKEEPKEKNKPKETYPEYKDKKELIDRVKELYLAKPDELCEKHENFKTYLEDNSHDEKKIKECFFDYESAKDWKTKGEELSYWLAKKLKVNVCPYCNRQFTFTVDTKDGKGNVRPQFDHFYPKSEYPYLALSFYNLVPSCATCNQSKSDKVEICQKGINPHSDGFPKDCRFTIDKIEKCVLGGNSEEWDISLPKEGKHTPHVNTLLLGDLYSQHKDYVEEIVFKAQSYSEGYYKSLIDSFSEFGLTSNEMNRIVFGNYIDPTEYGKRPLSKLTADILDQLDVLK